MASQVLWMIDNELDGARFERLCVDLLYRNGYRDIVPIEPQDGGRDAEEFPRRGRDREGCAAFFQFSLEQDWKAKLKRDAQKLSGRRTEFSTLVFVTSRPARGVDIDALTTKFREKYGWILIVYSREWLRMQLEVAHQDLAKKYLDVEAYTTSQGAVDLTASDPELASALAKIEARRYEAAIVELRAFLDNHPESDGGWRTLAWGQYCLDHMDEALAAINRALKLKDSPNSRSIRACILVEKGIDQRNKASVQQGLKVFEELLASLPVHTWHIFYNLGNALAALGRHRDAIEKYKLAVRLDASRPEIWKNLASSYHRVGDHKAEMGCFDKALELDPMKPEALVSKAISLMVDFNKPAEAVPLLETAVRFGSDLTIRWPQIWYWLAAACYESRATTTALSWIENGLAHSPGDQALTKLKSNVLATLIEGDGDFVEHARNFWQAELRVQPLNYDVRRRLARLEAAHGDNAAAWQLLDECFPLLEIKPASSLRASGVDISACITALEWLPQYSTYRHIYPVSDYWNPDDPLYGLPFLPPESRECQTALTTFLCVPFGLAVEQLEKSRDRESKEGLIGLFDNLREGIERAVSESARTLASLVPPRESGAESIAGKLTDLMLFLGLISLREFGRQRGWIAAQFQISAKSMDRAMEDYDESKIEKNVLVHALRTLDDECKLFGQKIQPEP